MKSDVVMLGYRNLPEKTQGGVHRRRLAAHRRHRRVRRGRLPEDRRPQEGADHQRGRQEHVAGEHRGDAEDRLAADRPGLLHRRRAPLQHRADRARRRLRAGCGRRKQGIEDTSLESLARDERVRAAVQEGVDAANAKLARVEQIKKFTIVEGDWLPGGDELTPTMKLKRKPIAEKYAERDRGDVRGVVSSRPARRRQSARLRRRSEPHRRPGRLPAGPPSAGRHSPNCPRVRRSRGPAKPVTRTRPDGRRPRGPATRSIRARHRRSPAPRRPAGSPCWGSR